MHGMVGLFVENNWTSKPVTYFRKKKTHHCWSLGPKYAFEINSKRLV